MEHGASPARNHRGSFPLAILFLFFTMAIVWGALLSAVARSLPDLASVSEVVFTTAGTSIVVALMGAMVGLFHNHRRWGMALGITSGLVVGSIAGPLLAVNERGINLAVGAQVAGSLLIVVTAAALRMLNRNAVDDDIEESGRSSS